MSGASSSSTKAICDTGAGSDGSGDGGGGGDRGKWIRHYRDKIKEREERRKEKEEEEAIRKLEEDIGASWLEEEEDRRRHARSSCPSPKVLPQSMLEDAMHWHASMLQSNVERERSVLMAPRQDNALQQVSDGQHLRKPCPFPCHYEGPGCLGQCQGALGHEVHDGQDHDCRHCNPMAGIARPPNLREGRTARWQFWRIVARWQF